MQAAGHCKEAALTFLGAAFFFTLASLLHVVSLLTCTLHIDTAIRRPATDHNPLLHPLTSMTEPLLQEGNTAVVARVTAQLTSECSVRKKY